MADYNNTTDANQTVVVTYGPGYPIYLTALSLRSIYIWVVAALGVPGNCAALATILSMRVTTATLFVAFLSVLDGISVVLKLIYHQLETYHIGPVVGVDCRVFELFVNLFPTSANWMLVLVCLERFVSVRFPLKKHLYVTKTRSYCATGVVLSVLFLIYTYYLYGDTCGGEFPSFPYKSWVLMQSVMYFMLPFVLVAVLTVLIVVYLHQYRRTRQSLRTTSSGEDSGMERAISIMLVCAAVVFLMLALPTCVYHLLSEEDCVSMGLIYIGQRVLFQQVAIMLADASHAVNFFVYFVSTGRFRNRFLELIRLKQMPCFRPASTPSSKTPSGTGLDKTQYTQVTQSRENLTTRV